MALGINYSSNFDAMPIVKWDARVGHMYRTERFVDGTGKWDTHNDDITATFKAVVDLEHIETGWISFKAGNAPSVLTVPLGEKVSEEPPTEFHKQGFRVTLKLSQNCISDPKQSLLRELASNAKTAVEGMDILHSAYATQVKDHPGQLPVVTLGQPIAKTTQTPTGKTTNYIPVYEIVGWAPRPADLIHKPTTAPAQQQQLPLQKGPAATGSTIVKPAEMVAATAATGNHTTSNVLPMKQTGDVSEFG
jgi:hypothetical protein